MRYATSAALLLQTALAAGSFTAPADAGTLAQRSFVFPAAHGRAFTFKGQRFVIGSASAKAAALRRELGPDVVVWPTGALFAADPSLNGVLVYDETATGSTRLPYGFLSGSNSGINGPVAVAVGTDQPCTTSCQQYLWVSNVGNGTITYYTLPLTSWNQTPSGVISWNGAPTCSSSQNSGPGLGGAYGIVHLGPPTANAIGTVIDASEAPYNGTYYLVGWPAEVASNSPISCQTSDTSALFDTASGPSAAVVNSRTEIFNANDTTVTETAFSQPSAWNNTTSWTVGTGACTEGTATQGSAVLWATTNACRNYTADGLWHCKIAAFPTCPAVPVCQNVPGSGPSYLDFPGYPATSLSTNRLYVPNIDNGTITSYKFTNAGLNCNPKATYVNAQTPVGVAVQN